MSGDDLLADLLSLSPLSPPPVRVLTLNLTFRLEASGELPRWKGAMLRGGLGRALKAGHCHPECARTGDDASRSSPQSPSSIQCPQQHNCPYHVIFEPLIFSNGVSAPDVEGRESKRDVTRPYVVCPPIEERKNTTLYSESDEISFGLVLIGKAIDYLAQVVLAFHTLGLMGLGSSLIPARVVSLQALNPLTGQVGQLPLMPSQPAVAAALDCFALTGAQVFRVAEGLPSTLLLRFHTPMRLKHGGQYLDHPLPYVMARAAVDRLSQLCEHFGGGPWNVPFASLVEGVQIKECHTHRVDWTRQSAATGQTMNLSGFVGSAVYSNVPPPLRALLLMGALAHIGKASVFGHGAYSINPVPERRIESDAC